MELIKFGFPIDHDGSTGGNHVTKNHKGAQQFLEDIKTYLEKEINLAATL